MTIIRFGGTYLEHKSQEMCAVRGLRGFRDVRRRHTGPGERAFMRVCWWWGLPRQVCTAECLEEKGDQRGSHNMAHKIYARQSAFGRKR